MPNRFFEDHHVGDILKSTGRTITEADIVNFSGVSGDFHPATMDRLFGRAAGYDRMLAHGALTFSITMGLAWQMKMNTKNLTYGFDRLRFVVPVLAGDTLRIVGTILSVSDYPKKPELGRVVMKLDAFNQDDALAFTCEHVMLIERSSHHNRTIGGELR